MTIVTKQQQQNSLAYRTNAKYDWHEHYDELLPELKH